MGILYHVSVKLLSLELSLNSPESAPRSDMNHFWEELVHVYWDNVRGVSNLSLHCTTRLKAFGDVLYSGSTP